MTEKDKINKVRIKLTSLNLIRQVYRGYNVERRGGGEGVECVHPKNVLAEESCAISCILEN